MKKLLNTFETKTDVKQQLDFFLNPSGKIRCWYGRGSNGISTALKIFSELAKKHEVEVIRCDPKELLKTIRYVKDEKTKDKLDIFEKSEVTEDLGDSEKKCGDTVIVCGRCSSISVDNYNFLIKILGNTNLLFISDRYYGDHIDAYVFETRFVKSKMDLKYKCDKVANFDIKELDPICKDIMDCL